MRALFDEFISRRAPMSKPKCPRPPNPARDARRQARGQVGMPPAERVIPDKRKRPPKHKKKWLEEM